MLMYGKVFILKRSIVKFSRLYKWSTLKKKKKLEKERYNEDY